MQSSVVACVDKSRDSWDWLVTGSGVDCMQATVYLYSFWITDNLTAFRITYNKPPEYTVNNFTG
jgi:hypothetical protein